MTTRPARHLPNLLSLSRIAMGVAMLPLFSLPAPWNSLACLALVALSGVTDVLDGQLARRNQTVSLAGKWLDPISDLTFYFFVFLTFWRKGLMPLAFFLLFMGRELAMYSVIRPLTMVRRLDPAAKLPGKLKTIGQSIGSMLVLAVLFFTQVRLLPGRFLPVLSFWILTVPIALSLASLYWYIRPLFAVPGKEPPGHAQTGRIILVSVLVFFLLHCLFLAGLTWLYGLAWQRLLLFLAVGAVYHALFLGGLLLVRGEFNLEPSGELLRGLNLPLILSFMRFSAIPAILYLFLSLRSYPAIRSALVPFLAFILLTDLLDGILARRLRQTTRIGRILDSSGDYVLTIVMSIVYTANQWIPVWLLVLVLVRLAAQLTGIVALYILRGYTALRLSFLGKASIFAVFCLYGLELMEFLNVPVIGNHLVVTVLEFATGGILAASLVEKAVLLVRDFSRPEAP